MTRWGRGEATILKLLADRHLQAITGEMTDGQAWLDKATRTLSTAERVTGDDPESALVLAYDAGRQIATGLLAQQGLRPTTAGGHLAVVRAIIAQFDGPFTELDTLRRRRRGAESFAVTEAVLATASVCLVVAANRNPVCLQVVRY